MTNDTVYLTLTGKRSHQTVKTIAYLIGVVEDLICANNHNFSNKIDMKVSWEDEEEEKENPFEEDGR